MVMFNNRINRRVSRFLTRLGIVYLLHLVIKGFDYSFGGFADFTHRGIVISAHIISLWLSFWYLSEYLNKKITKKSQLVKISMNLMFGFLLGVFTNTGYRFIDVTVYNQIESWEKMSLINPELTVSIMIFYMVIFIVDENIQGRLALQKKEFETLKLEKENITAQYNALKAQVEPHFLFNSLSVLSSMIHVDADKSSEFVVKLSKTLRYILEKNKFTTVSLSEEMKMVEDYFYLLKSRFDQAVVLNIECEDDNSYNKFVPPVSVQMLIENAIKHNKYSAGAPLVINVNVKSDAVSVENNVDLVSVESSSLSIGLENIKKRYQLLSGDEVVVTKDKEHFVVELPLLMSNADEKINMNDD